MYVYLNIVELSRVGNSQVTIMSCRAIRSSFQKKGQWVFILHLYDWVMDKNINTITIKHCTETNEEILFILDGLVTCRLHICAGHSWHRGIKRNNTLIIIIIQF